MRRSNIRRKNVRSKINRRKKRRTGTKKGKVIDGGSDWVDFPIRAVAKMKLLKDDSENAAKELSSDELHKYFTVRGSTGVLSGYPKLVPPISEISFLPPWNATSYIQMSPINQLKYIEWMKKTVNGRMRAHRKHRELMEDRSRVGDNYRKKDQIGKLIVLDFIGEFEFISGD